MKWSPELYMNERYAMEINRQQMARESASGRKNEEIIQGLRQALGQFERNAELDVKLLESVQCDGYIRERVEFSVIPGLSFATYVLIPTKGQTNERLKEQYQTVIAVHGHGYGSKQIIGLTLEGEEHDEDDLYHNFGISLVKKGMLVIIPDIVGYGERMLEIDRDPTVRPQQYSCHRLTGQLMMYGQTLAGLRTEEMLGVFQYAKGRSDVNKEQIGIAGISGGGLIAALVSIFQRDIKATVLMGYPNTYKDSIMSVHHCICNFIPGMLQLGEMPELLGTIAPRALFIESGANDPIFPLAGFELAVEHLQKEYTSLDASDHFSFDVFPGQHEIGGQHSFDWLNSQLLASPASTR